MGQDVSYVPAVPPKLAKCPLCTHDHALRRGNGCGCRRVLLALAGFLPALVSPFTARSAAALPPMRRSLKVSCAITPLTQRFRIMVAIIAPFFRLSRGNHSQCPQKFRLQIAATLQRGGDLPQQGVPVAVESPLQRQVVAGVVGAEHSAFTVHVL